MTRYVHHHVGGNGDDATATTVGVEVDEGDEAALDIVCARDQARRGEQDGHAAPEGGGHDRLVGGVQRGDAGDAVDAAGVVVDGHVPGDHDPGGQDHQGQHGR